MKQNLSDVFIDWILKKEDLDDLMYYDLELKNPKQMNYYPNSVKGMQFIFDHCSCVNTELKTDDFRDPKLSIYFKPDVLFHFGNMFTGEFEIYKGAWYNDSHSKKEPIKWTVRKIYDFKNILEPLIRYTLERIPDEKIEKFLMEQI